jgi:curved DNA-binding protein CbpA
MDDVALRQWLSALDALSYYDVLRAPNDASHDDLRLCFHAFAETFHPDGHLWRAPHEQEAIGVIYRRGAEAWRILSDPALRARYDEALVNGSVRPENLAVEADRPSRPKALLADKLRSPSARPFVLRAEELYKKGDPKQAKIQLVMALHMDRGNPALDAFAKQLDEAIAEKTEEEKKSWRK